MILTNANADRPHATTNIGGKDVKFNIAANAKAFTILTDKLYTDPIQAIIRELASNCVDSHAAANKSHIAWNLHLPTVVEPWIEFEDYGVGMTPKEIEEIYASFFTSTKDQSNDAIGAFGLGSKTPLIYTDNFAITSTVDHTTHTYVSYINAVGVPALKHVSSHPTTRTNGVSIKFAVKLEDADRFVVKAAQALLAYNTPITCNIPDLFGGVTIDDERIVLNAAPFCRQLPWSYKWAVRIGKHNVIWLDDLSQYIKLSKWSNAKGLMLLIHAWRSTMSDSNTLNIAKYPLIDVNIGDVDITPSRDSITLTKKSADGLVNALLPMLIKWVMALPSMSGVDLGEGDSYSDEAIEVVVRHLSKDPTVALGLLETIDRIMSLSGTSHEPLELMKACMRAHKFCTSARSMLSVLPKLHHCAISKTNNRYYNGSSICLWLLQHGRIVVVDNSTHTIKYVQDQLHTRNTPPEWTHTPRGYTTPTFVTKPQTKNQQRILQQFISYSPSVVSSKRLFPAVARSSQKPTPKQDDLGVTCVYTASSNIIQAFNRRRDARYCRLDVSVSVYRMFTTGNYNHLLKAITDARGIDELLITCDSEKAMSKYSYNIYNYSRGARNDRLLQMMQVPPDVFSNSFSKSLYGVRMKRGQEVINLQPSTIGLLCYIYQHSLVGAGLLAELKPFVDNTYTIAGYVPTTSHSTCNEAVYITLLVSSSGASTRETVTISRKLMELCQFCTLYASTMSHEPSQSLHRYLQFTKF